MCSAVGICFSYSFIKRGMDLHAKAGHDSLKKQFYAWKSCVWDPDFGAVNRPMWARSKHSLQGLRKSQTGDFKLKHPMDV